jgi:hypothetical protein
METIDNILNKSGKDDFISDALILVIYREAIYIYIYLHMLFSSRFSYKPASSRYSLRYVNRQ